ncbi:MAG TPA: hypothetical protein VGK29_07860 [Paludibaculum sp.]|jgi:hypothetical protein
MRQVLALLLICTAFAQASVFRRAFRRTSGQALRHRLFTSPLITNPGGVDLEFGSIFDPQGGFTLPTTLKYTPATWQTEFSVGVDTVASMFDDDGNRTTHFSDHVNFAATTAFRVTDNFSWAVAPTMAVFLRGDEGLRLGGALLARYDHGTNTFSSATTWSGATVNSPTNPAGIFDLTTGYACKFGRLTPYANVQLERASGVATQYSIFEGVEWQLNPRFSIDLGGQHYALNTPQPDHHFSIGLTYSLH